MFGALSVILLTIPLYKVVAKKRTNQPVVMSHLAKETPSEPRVQDPSIIENDTGGRVNEEAVSDDNYIDNIIDVGEQHNKDADIDEIYENLDSIYNY